LTVLEGRVVAFKYPSPESKLTTMSMVSVEQK